MKHRFTLSALALCVCSASVRAQSAEIFGLVSSTTVQPNEPVTIELYAQWSGVANWRAFAGIDAVLNASGGEILFVNSGELDPGLTVTQGSGTASLMFVVGQFLCSIISCNPVTSNPVKILEVQWTGQTAGVFDIATATNLMVVYVGGNGASIHLTPTEFSTQITVVPGPATLGVFVAGAGLIGVRRRR